MGKSIVFTHRADGHLTIWRMDATGGNGRSIHSGGGDNSVPTWSPDGTRIAFVNEVTGKAQIYVMDADGSRTCGTSTAEWAGRRNPRGRPTGPASRSKRIATATTKFMSRAWRRSFRFAGPKILPTMTGRCGHSTGSASRLRATGNGKREIFVLDRPGGTPRNLTENPADDFEAAWSPDGAKIAFISDRGGKRDIYMMPSAGGAATRLTELGGCTEPVGRPTDDGSRSRKRRKPGAYLGDRYERGRAAAAYLGRGER